MLLKKVVVDNMKECADKYANNVCKTISTDEKSIHEFSDIELEDDMENLIQNYIFFKNKYSSSVTTDSITAYISYLLVCNTNYKSYTFFKSCLYAKAEDTVKKELLTILKLCTNFELDQELFNYGKLLTSPLILTKYDCFDREKEVEECIDILSRLRKNNAILVGDAGVGKTCVVSGICNYLQSTKCPDNLKNYCVFELNINKVVSGTTYRGDLEKRIDKLLETLSNSNVIVFIDEIHMVFTKAGTDDDTSVIQNVFKTYLTNDLKVIGCTTTEEYKVIESDKAFERRFSIVHINEPSIDTAESILIQSKNEFEKYHKLSIDNDMCRYIVKESNTYIKNRNFPDKAFDIIDKACVFAAKRDSDVLERSDIDNAIYLTSNVNPKASTVFDIDNIEKDINTVIIAQEHAVKSVCRSLKKFYVGVNDKKKPIGSFLFVGSTGVGKTELCKQLANRCFNSKSFIRYDMSEFMEPHSVSKLIGAPPGYVGYKHTDTLTERVKHNPFSIILFDEIEKAHKDVVNVLLQILDDGRLTDAVGTTVYFCNCIIILTSNIGCREYNNKNSIGFSESQKDVSIIMKRVNEYFSPEFRNRLDEVILFNTITKDVFDKIFNNKLKDYVNKFSDIDIHLSFTESAIESLKSKCFSEEYGARYIVREINNNLDGIILDNIDKKELLIDYINNSFQVEEKSL
jgi:ATP-dependent Clp protease ATP-binding subunit ClpA